MNNNKLDTASQEISHPNNNENQSEDYENSFISESTTLTQETLSRTPLPMLSQPETHRARPTPHTHLFLPIETH